MNQKPQIFIDEALQWLVDKYAITYQNNWSEGLVWPHGDIVTLGNYWQMCQTYPVSYKENIFGSSC